MSAANVSRADRHQSWNRITPSTSTATSFHRIRWMISLPRFFPHGGDVGGQMSSKMSNSGRPRTPTSSPAMSSAAMPRRFWSSRSFRGQQLADELEHAPPLGLVRGRAQPRHQRTNRQHRGERIGAGRQSDRDIEAGPVQVRPGIARLRARARARHQLPFARCCIKTEDAHRRRVPLSAAVRSRARFSTPARRDLTGPRTSIASEAKPKLDRGRGFFRAQPSLLALPAPLDQLEAVSWPRPAGVGIVETDGGELFRMRDRLTRKLPDTMPLGSP